MYVFVMKFTPRYPYKYWDQKAHIGSLAVSLFIVVVVVVVVFTLKAVPVSTQYFLTSVLVQLTRTPSVVTG